LCGSQFSGAIWVDSSAHAASRTHDIVFRIKAADNCREIFVNLPAQVVAQKGARVGVMHDKVAHRITNSA
jgi:hypothetical protein